MYNQIANSFDYSGDLMEIGLIAFASPEFADAFVRELLGQDQVAQSASPTEQTVTGACKAA